MDKWYSMEDGRNSSIYKMVEYIVTKSHMPIFRAGGSTINLPNGASYVCKGSRDTAEFRLCPGMQLGQYYKVSCKDGQLSWVQVDEPKTNVNPSSKFGSRD